MSTTTLSHLHQAPSFLSELANILAAVTIVIPAFALVLFFMLSLLSNQLTERRLLRFSIATFAFSSLSAILSAIFFTLSPDQAVDLHFIQAQFGAVFQVAGYHFDLGLLLDRYSLAYLVLIHLLCLSIASFSSRYLIQEKNAPIFWKLLLLFGMSLSLLTLAHTLDLLFIGWEMVGISSALLIAFYRDRMEPVKHSLMAFTIYRICDIGLLLAIVVLHHAVHSGDLLAHTHPEHIAHINDSATLFGFLILFASMGKSAQFPFFGWLPRAMEGPTPSSAIFYGALSVHAGAYLLIRTAPMWNHSSIVAVVIFIIGLLTTMIGNLSTRAQSDVKSKLAFAIISQVGLIFMEIALGFYGIAMIHIIGHAILRTLQLLRAPSTLDDILNLENRLGTKRPEYPWLIQKLLTPEQSAMVYRFAVERAWTDHLAFQIAHQSKKALLALNWVEQQMSAIFDHKVEERLRELPEFKGNLIDFGFLEDESYLETHHDEKQDHKSTTQPSQILNEKAEADIKPENTKQEHAHPRSTLLQKTASTVKTKLRSKFGKKTGGRK